MDELTNAGIVLFIEALIARLEAGCRPEKLEAVADLSLVLLEYHERSRDDEPLPPILNLCASVSPLLEIAADPTHEYRFSAVNCLYVVVFAARMARMHNEIAIVALPKLRVLAGENELADTVKATIALLEAKGDAADSAEGIN